MIQGDRQCLKETFREKAFISELLQEFQNEDLIRIFMRVLIKELL